MENAEQTTEIIAQHFKMHYFKVATKRSDKQEVCHFVCFWGKKWFYKTNSTSMEYACGKSVSKYYFK